MTEKNRQPDHPRASAWARLREWSNAQPTSFAVGLLVLAAVSFFLGGVLLGTIDLGALFG